MVVVVRYFGGILLGLKPHRCLQLSGEENLGTSFQRYCGAPVRALLQLDYEAYGKLYEDLARLVSEPEALFQEQVIMQGWVDVARKDDVEQLAAKVTCHCSGRRRKDKSGLNCCF